MIVRFKHILLSTVVLLFLSAGAFACEINGEIVAEPNADGNGLGAWKYTLTVAWDTDLHGVSHINLLVDDGANCDGQDLMEGLAFEDIVGTSGGEPDGCTVQYFALLEGAGDATHPEINGPIIKFEYLEDVGCEPASMGTAVLVFYSEYPPGEIDDPNLFVADKHAQEFCFGQLTGVFPTLPCDPLGDDGSSWGQLKSSYLH